MGRSPNDLAILKHTPGVTWGAASWVEVHTATTKLWWGERFCGVDHPNCNGGTPGRNYYACSLCTSHIFTHSYQIWHDNQSWKREFLLLNPPSTHEAEWKGSQTPAALIGHSAIILQYNVHQLWLTHLLFLVSVLFLFYIVSYNDVLRWLWNVRFLQYGRVTLLLSCCYLAKWVMFLPLYVCLSAG